jgi:hypothetical protein
MAGNAAVDFAGTICLIFSGPGLSPNGTPPAYPARGSCAPGQSAVTFAGGVAGVVPVTLYAAGPVSIAVTDSAGHSNGAGLALVVGPAGLSAFAIPTPISQVAGVQFPVAITARDAYGNTASGYTGARCLVF